MSRSFIWSTSRFCAWAYIIQYLFKWFITCHKSNGITRYGDDNTLYDPGNFTEDIFHPYRNRPKNILNGFPIIKCKEILENVIRS